MEIRELTEETERREAVPILRQLWGNEDPADVLAWTEEEEHRLFGGFEDGDLMVSLEFLLSNYSIMLAMRGSTTWL